MDKRAAILHAASGLTLGRGFRSTTLARVAREARVPLGNIYYYFKTKNEIAAAIVDERLEDFRSRTRDWAALPSARERLLAFVAMVSANRSALAENGCPLGSFCTELNKYGGRTARSAARLLSEPLAWMEAQLRELGKGKDSADLAIHILSVVQGVAVLANTLHDPKLVDVEARRLERWIREL